MASEPSRRLACGRPILLRHIRLPAVEGRSHPDMAEPPDPFGHSINTQPPYHELEAPMVHIGMLYYFGIRCEYATIRMIV
jgi:hypothetical protein